MTIKNNTDNPISKIKLSCNDLKLIACIFMIIDHVGYGLLHNYMITHTMDILPETYQTYNKLYEFCRGAGRLAFPIFCFFVVEGFLRTRNVTRYAVRLGIFALISEIPFDLGLYGKLWYWNHQNTIFTFFIALLMLILLKSLEGNILGLSKPVVYLTYICAVIGFADIAYLLKADYSWKCMLTVSVLYFARGTETFRLLAGAISTCWEKYGSISFLLLYFYDPERPPKRKYAFYIFYPLHLLIIYAVSRFII